MPDGLYSCGIPGENERRTDGDLDRDLLIGGDPDLENLDRRDRDLANLEGGDLDPENRFHGDRDPGNLIGDDLYLPKSGDEFPDVNLCGDGDFDRRYADPRPL